MRIFVLLVLGLMIFFTACSPYAEEDIGKKFGDKGVFKGYMYSTYYYLAEEKNYSGEPATVPVLDARCLSIKRVPKGFYDDLAMQGSGKLSDGRVVSYSNQCLCARASANGSRICYEVLDMARYPWGRGANNKKIVPLRTWAVDKKVIKSGSVIYAEEWDGVFIPQKEGIGGFTHDGCFIATDVGAWIKGEHYDFNAGTRKMWKELEKVVSTRTYFSIFLDASRCRYLKNEAN